MNAHKNNCCQENPYMFASYIGLRTKIIYAALLALLHGCSVCHVSASYGGDLTNPVDYSLIQPGISCNY